MTEDSTPSAYRPLPALNKFTNNRTAPGTPAGNCRKKAYPA